MTNCIFCKIVKKEIPSEVVYEDEKVLAFRDIKPKAPTHFLIIPKKHIESVESSQAEKVTPKLISAAKKIAGEEEIAGYRLVFNVGEEGGQVIRHLHLHLLAGKPIQLP